MTTPASVPRGQQGEPTATAAAVPCRHCNGTGIAYVHPLDALADAAWAANRPGSYIKAIRDLRIADDRVRGLRHYKDAIDRAKERAGDA